MIRDATITDLPALTQIYNQAVLATTATFDIDEQSPERRRSWFDHYGGKYPLIVAEKDGRVVGYSTLSPYRSKPAYSLTVESSVYVDSAFHGQGIGRELMREALRRASAGGFHAVLAGITGGNEASTRLHIALGFRHVGQLREVGRKFGTWQDVHFYELILEDMGQA